MAERAEFTAEKDPIAEKPGYQAPKMEKHAPVKVVHGSGSCSGLYYVSLYTLYS